MAGNVDRVQLQVEVVRNQLDTLIKDVNSLKGQKLSISVESSGMEAINKFNASIKTMEQSVGGLNGKFTKIWDGVADGVPARTIETVNNGLGRTTEIIRTLDEETQSYTTVQTKTTANYDQMAKAAQKAAEQAEKLRQQQEDDMWAQHNAELEQQAKVLGEVSKGLDDYAAKQEKAEQKVAAQTQKEIELYNKQADAAEKAAAALQQRQEGDMWRSYNAELENQQRILSETDRAWAEYAKQQADAEQQIAESTKKEVAWYDSWLDGQDKIFESAQKNMPTLQKQYADLARSIESATAKYPEGTFDRLSGEVSSARESLRALDAGLADGTVSYEDYVNGVDKAKAGLKGLQSEFSQTQADTEKLKNSTNILGDSLSNIVKKIVAWQVINASVAKVIGMFREAVSVLKEVDTELTAIQKVTNNTDAEMAKLSEHAYEVASQYGVAVTDYLESTGTFAKAGYKELSEDMAELATKTQLVGDVNAETANQFLLSADAAYKMEGNVTRLSTVLDKANVIENNYATSIQKMAEGFPIVANVASMANMDIDELMAGLGTITAVTQESGTKAATALRALILNIMGDTKTEIADGVTWTKDEIENLTQVLWTYSKEAMEAAQASGKIVDPMKAIAGLAQAAKEGVLTEAELAQIESDLGGKLRTNQLDALIKNYDMYAEMLDKVADSAGSADQEVEIMLSSWESKTNILQNKWTEFISHVVETDAIKTALDGVIGLVDILDSDVGHFILTVAGVTAAVFGVVAAVKALQVAVAKLNMTSLLNPVLAVGAALGIVVAAIIAISNGIKQAAEDSKFENLIEKYRKLNEEVNSTADSLDECRKKLEELNAVEPADRSSTWQNEVDKLNEEIEAYKYLLELRKQDAAETADKAFSADRVVGAKVKPGAFAVYDEYTKEGIPTQNANVVGIEGFGELTADQIRALNEEYANTEDALRGVAKAFYDVWTEAQKTDFAEAVAAGDTAEQTKILSKIVKGLGIDIIETKVSSDEWTRSQAALGGTIYNTVHLAAKAGEELSKAQKEQADQFISTNSEYYEYLQAQEELTYQQQAFTAEYERFAKAMAEYDIANGLMDESEAVLYLVNSLGLTENAAISAVNGLVRVGGAAKVSADNFVSLKDGTLALKSACIQAEDGTWSLKEGLDAVGNSADDTSDSVENLAEQMQDAAKALTSQKNDLKTANAALDEYQRVGKITASTLQSLLGMSEGYINVLIDENGKLKITEDTLRDLVSAIYEDIEATNDQIGVTDDANVSAEAFVSSLMDEAKQSAKTGQAVRELVLEEIKLNSTSLNLEQQIAAVVALGQAAGATAASIAMLSAYGGTSASNAERTISGYLQTGQAKTRAEAEAKYLQNLYNQLDFSKTDTSTSTSGGGGSGTDARLEALKDRVSLLKSELTLMEKQGKSADEQKAKMKEIQQALHAQAQYLRSIGGNEADINDLSAEWWDWQKKINGELEDSADLLDELKNALQDTLNRQQDARDAELKAIDDQIDALKKQKDEKDKQVELEEKLLAIQQAEAALAAAQAERTVRQYNSSSGQWEWVANQKDIDDAQEALDKARKDLEDFQDQAAYDARLAELEAQKDAINAKYDALEAQYDRFLDSLKEKTRGIGEILQDILKNATPELRQIILENAELFKSFGIDVSELLNSFTETVKKIVRVLPGGKAPAGLNVGDQVVTGGGTFEITGVNPDGSYESKKVDPNQTIYNYTGPYDDVPGGYTGPNQYPSGGGSSGSRGGRTVRVESGTGKAPKGLSVGDKVVTAVGTYIITAVNPDGSYQSQMYDKNQTIYNFRGTYDAYDNGGILRGMGAIKATGRDEFVADPDTTELLKQRFGNWKALSPARDTQSDRIMRGIRMTLGAQNGANAANSYSSNSIGTQYNGPLYQLGGVTITEREAQTMTVKKLADAARTLVIKAQA